jgi:tetratricopeptide (TPR) repeat protein
MTWNQYIEEGTTAVRRGDHAAAEKSLKAALAFAKEKFSRSDSRLALTLSLLGHVYFKIGDFGRSEKLLEQSLKLHAASDHLNDPCLLMDLFTLAEIKQAGGKNSEACRLYDETLERLQCQNPQQAEIIQQATSLFRKMADEIRPATTASEPAAQPESEPTSAPVPAEAPREKGALPLPKMQLREAGSAGEIWQQQFQTGLASMKMDDAECDELITAYLNFESAFRLANGMFAKDDMRLIATAKGLADASTKLRLFDQAEALYHDAIARTRANTANAAAAGNSIRLALGLMYVEANNFKQARTIFDEESIEGLPREAQHLRKRLEDASRVLRRQNIAWPKQKSRRAWATSRKRPKWLTMRFRSSSKHSRLPTSRTPAFCAIAH